MIKGLDQLKVKLDNIADTATIKQAVKKGAALVERDAKIKCPYRTGELRRSIEYDVIELGNSIQGIVGSSLERAPYVEFGTGLYATKGDGRQDVPWLYKDDEGKTHITSGQRPQPYLHPAFDQNKQKIKALLEDAVKEALND